MSTEQNKAILRRHFDELWNRGNLGLVDELFASDCLAHVPPDEVEGHEGLKQYMSAVRRAFPDFQFMVEDVVAEGDRVATRWTARAAHMDEFLGITGFPPQCVVVATTGRQNIVTGISIYRLADGKVVECWTLTTKSEAK